MFMLYSIFFVRNHRRAEHGRGFRDWSWRVTIRSYKFFGMSLRARSRLIRFRRPVRLLRLAAAGVALIAVATVLEDGGAAKDRTVLSGPIRARVLRVVDGDTLVVRARIWLGQDVRTLVRLSGIDAPEMRGRCEAERIAARRARTLLRALVGAGAVVLTDIRLGKYAGRVLARVTTPAGEDVADRIRQAGLARAYGGGRRGSWCQRAERSTPSRGLRDGR